MSDYTGTTIDHLNVTTTDLERSRAFYDAALGAIGIERLLDFPAEGERPAMVGYGRHPKPDFWLVEGDTADPNLHIGFLVRDRNLVHAFHDAALAAGGVEREAPAVHPEYHADYYGGFVTDPSGYNVEAVCHEPG